MPRTVTFTLTVEIPEESDPIANGPSILTMLYATQERITTHMGGRAHTSIVAEARERTERSS